jgi:hypothetical protein
MSNSGCFLHRWEPGMRGRHFTKHIFMMLESGINLEVGNPG